MRIAIFTALFFLSFESLFSQVEYYEINLTSGKSLQNSQLQKLASDTLIFTHLKSTQTLPVDSIAGFRIIKKPNYLTGVGLGFLAGAIFGTWLINEIETGEPSAGESTGGIILGGLGGALIGTGIAKAAHSGNVVYDLSLMEKDHKLSMVRVIMSKQ